MEDLACLLATVRTLKQVQFSAVNHLPDADNHALLCQYTEATGTGNCVMNGLHEQIAWWCRYMMCWATWCRVTMCMNKMMRINKMQWSSIGSTEKVIQMTISCLNNLFKKICVNS